MEVLGNVLKTATLIGLGYVLGVTRTCKEYEKNPIEIYAADKKVITDTAEKASESISNSVESVKEKFAKKKIDVEA